MNLAEEEQGAGSGSMGAPLAGAWRLYVRALLFVLAILFSVGAAGHVIPAATPMMLFLTPGFSLVVGLLVLAPSVASGGWRFVLWALGIFVVAFLMDVAGVSSGAAGGEYVFGQTLGWKWHGVPPVITLNCVLVANGLTCIAGRIVPAPPWRWRVPAVALVAGALAVAFDLLMEPVATRLDYWAWTEGSVPMQNYMAWFLLAGLASTLHPNHLRSSSEIGSAGRLAGVYVAMQAVFFTVLLAIWHWQGT